MNMSGVSAGSKPIPLCHSWMTTRLSSTLIEDSLLILFSFSQVVVLHMQYINNTCVHVQNGLAYKVFHDHTFDLRSICYAENVCVAYRTTPNARRGSRSYHPKIHLLDVHEIGVFTESKLPLPESRFACIPASAFRPRRSIDLLRAFPLDKRLDDGRRLHCDGGVPVALHDHNLGHE